MTNSESGMSGPLEGLRVLDLTSYLSQHCARSLGDMGADVIMVEPPDGDPARMLPPFAGNIEHPERSLRFIHANRSKRGVVLDITDAADRESIAALAARSDILVEDFKPGYLESVGLGYEDLKAGESESGLCVDYAFWADRAARIVPGRRSDRAGGGGDDVRQRR